MPNQHGSSNRDSDTVISEPMKDIDSHSKTISYYQHVLAVAKCFVNGHCIVCTLYLWNVECISFYYILCLSCLQWFRCLDERTMKYEN